MKIVLFFIFLVIAFERFIFTIRVPERVREQRYRYLSFLLMSTYLICVAIALIDFSLKMELIMSYSLVGLSLILCGTCLRRKAVKILGNFWSWYIKYIPGQQVVQKGVYKWVRHPYYLAVMMELLGVAFFFNSYLTFCFVIFVHFPLLLLRAFLEEKFLSYQLGESYELYKVNVGMFIPKLTIRK